MTRVLCLLTGISGLVGALDVVAWAQHAPMPGAGAGRGMEAVGSRPDFRSMAGLPLPDPSLPAGRVTVRVVAGDMDHPVAGAQVWVEDERGRRVSGPATTGGEGRANLTVPPGGSGLVVQAVFEGTKTTSRLFDAPRQGGLRFLLFLPRGAGQKPGPEGTGKVGERAGGGTARGTQSGVQAGRAGPQQSTEPRAGAGPVSGRLGRALVPPAGDRVISGKGPVRLSVQLRIQAVEAGRVTAELSYVLNVGPGGLREGAALPLLSGFHPASGHPSSWYLVRDAELVVAQALPPGRHQARLPGWFEPKGGILVLVQESPWLMDRFLVVSRRYSGLEFVGPRLVATPMGQGQVVYAVEPGARRVAVTIRGLPVRTRGWAYAVVAFAVLLALGLGLLGVRRTGPR